ncbi:uncharacterized protein LOC130949728 [Arachis stenosperma]|uniref:uncharacterized protein LOC130949728 n=1 Tax=Arachis stenosperma TaxID=217475 RepID=UPI0025ACE0EE|nr:uncharacterized protein LOC130949728 [Arachis stenosperma]
MCFNLKNVIEKLARDGQLDWDLANKADEPRKSRRDEEVGRVKRSPHTPKRHVNMINGGFAGGRISKSSRKGYLKEVYHVGEGDRSPDLPTIIFTQEDATSIIPGHNDPMVITIILANANLHRMLVDQWSSGDILFKSAFDKLGLQEKELRAYWNSLFGLGDTRIQTLGYILLHTTFGKGTLSRTLSIDYIVVDVSSAYNALVGRTTLNQLTAGNPRGEEINTIEFGGVRVHEELCPQPEGETEEVQIRDAQNKITNIGATLKRDLKEPLIQFLMDNADLFAWNAADMPDIDPKLMCYKLAVYPGSRPVQQKRRKLGPERTQAVEEQVQALLEAGFIREVKYPLWLPDVVFVKKSNGKWRMCTNYTDLNKTCPKDPYPLLNIDTLVDASSKYKYISFTDAYSGYNQIPMYPSDQEKTSFLIPKATY